jgi:hypothetical protein
MKIADWIRSVLGGSEKEELPDAGDTLYGLSVADALRGHLEWVARFEDALRKGAKDIDPDQVVHDDRCVLGRWILATKAQGRIDADDPDFRELREAHTAFHRTASILAQAVRQDQKTESRLLLDLLRAKSRQIRIALARHLSETGGMRTGS